METMVKVQLDKEEMMVEEVPVLRDFVDFEDTPSTFHP